MACEPCGLLPAFKKSVGEIIIEGLIESGGSSLLLAVV
ncbi:hypothetical protein ANAPC5_00822 [Anaplasma phagocytophilum]|nr:hypothetical protein ANAPC2_01023 [Anaplasma phagocytophilum]SBO32879.1 hypothetical protein ANAPC4_00961 [Anaplasma phagocytophilum]SBO32982.1 hypothetical protein ANAPC3_01058 [Anaplasma phagocytophilum]SCV64282.1 hypothetical protein ANAPC5_00822 [Anaplasma phagocytophilum]